VAEAPTAVVTVTSTGPDTVPAGSPAVIDVLLLKVTLVAATPPKSTSDPLVKFAPVIVTGTSELVPLLGLTPVTYGTDEAVTVSVNGWDVLWLDESIPTKVRA